MAFTCTALGLGSNKSSGVGTYNLTGLTLAQDVATDELLIVCKAYDNAAANGGALSAYVTIDGASPYNGSTFKDYPWPFGGLSDSYRSPGGAANDGVAGNIGYAYPYQSLPQSLQMTVQTTGTTPPTAKTYAMWKLKAGAGSLPKFETGCTPAGGTGTTYSVTTTGTVTTGWIVIGCVMYEYSSNPGAASSTTNGTWSTAQVGGTSGGNAATNIRLSTQYKIITGGTATCTFNGTLPTSSDWIAWVGAFSELTVDPPMREYQRNIMQAVARGSMG